MSAFALVNSGWSNGRIPYCLSSSGWAALLGKWHPQNMRSISRSTFLCAFSVSYRLNADIVPGAWTIYNTVRYFLAFTMYNSTAGQAMSLALGISTGSSFALLVCAAILSVFQPYLLHHGVPLKTLLFSRKSIQAFSSFLISAPAVYNLVMTIIWRNSTDDELNFQHRCHLDIDVVWSVSGANCRGLTWGPWFALSIIRLILTLVIIVSSLLNFLFPCSILT